MLVNKLLFNYTSAIIDGLHKEAQRRLEVANANINGGSKENYTANMAASLVLQSLASAYMATRDVKE